MPSGFIESPASVPGESPGGLLINSVVPSGLGRKKRKNVVVPQGCVERAQLGLQLLKTAITDLAQANLEGITNADAASLLGLRSDYRGKQKDYLSYSVIGLLLPEGKITRDYGASFGVASAFLRKAGAVGVTGVALGKFGSKLHEFDIQIDGDPFAQLTASQFSVKMPSPWVGSSSNTTQQILLNLIP